MPGRLFAARCNAHLYSETSKKKLAHLKTFLQMEKENLRGKRNRTGRWKKWQSRRMKILKEDNCLGLEKEEKKQQKQGRELGKGNKEGQQ